MTGIRTATETASLKATGKEIPTATETASLTATGKEIRTATGKEIRTATETGIRTATGILGTVTGIPMPGAGILTGTRSPMRGLPTTETERQRSLAR